jgi:hypothetical protein
VPHERQDLRNSAEISDTVRFLWLSELLIASNRPRPIFASPFQLSIFFGNFNVRVGRDDVLKLWVGNVHLQDHHQIICQKCGLRSFGLCRRAVLKVLGSDTFLRNVASTYKITGRQNPEAHTIFSLPFAAVKTNLSITFKQRLVTSDSVTNNSF